MNNNKINQPEKQSCPLCSEDAELFSFFKAAGYYKCPECSALFLDKNKRLSPEKEKERYLQHNNDIFDQNYRNFVSPITVSVMNEYSSLSLGLDFGAGTGPVITRVLEEAGYKMKMYDPFFHDDKSVLQTEYDYIVCCEVMEHFYHPSKEFTLLSSLLKKGGKLYCMTELFYDEINFSSWYYKNDPSHVFFYNKNTLEYIKNRYDFSELSIDKRLIVFGK